MLRRGHFGVETGLVWLRSLADELSEGSIATRSIERPAPCHWASAQHQGYEDRAVNTNRGWRPVPYPARATSTTSMKSEPIWNFGRFEAQLSH